MTADDYNRDIARIERQDRLMMIAVGCTITILLGIGLVGLMILL
jgi:hypothetical protein